MTFELTASLLAMRADKGGGQVLVRTPGSQLVLRSGEVISLEGANQTGKSTVIKTLVGAHKPKRRSRLRNPRRYSVEVQCTMQLEGRTYQPRSINEALANGVVAVFQDDRLLRNMTVSEQLVLRHGYVRGWGWLWNVAWDWIHPLIEKLPESLPEQWPIRGSVEAFVKRLPGPKQKPIDVLRGAEKLMASFDVEGRPKFAESLEKFPDELSGGAKAIVRLTGALLEPKLRFLILDEAFSNVDPDIWVHALEQLRDRVQRAEIGILFVSHVPAERMRWQPTRRYKIDEGILESLPTAPGTLHSLQPPPREVREISVFEVDGEDLPAVPGFILSEFCTPPFAIIIDDAVSSRAAAKQLISWLEAKEGNPVPTLSISVRERDKTIGQAVGILEYINGRLNADRGTIFCIGGGTLINSAGLASSLFLRGRVPTIYVPTTLTAIADVAIGSKTGVNMWTDDLALKHAVGTHFDPSGVVLDRRFLEGLDRRKAIEGMAEIFKHGIVQDAKLLNECLDLLTRSYVDPSILYSLAKRTMLLKQEMIIEDWAERKIGRALQFGHLHAHSLERAARFSIPHNRAVWCGLFVDTYLGSPHLVTTTGHPLHEKILEVLKEIIDPRDIPPDEELFEGYRRESKREALGGDSVYSILRLKDIGCYSDPEQRTIDSALVGWMQVAGAWTVLRGLGWSQQKP